MGTVGLGLKVWILAAIIAIVASVMAEGPRVANAGGSGTVGFTALTKRAAVNATDFQVSLDAKSLQTLANCYLDPNVVATGSGLPVTYGTTSVTDTSKTFTANAYVGKPVNVSGQTLVSGPSPSYTLTSVTDTTATFAPNALAGLTVTAAYIYGSGPSVTYTQNSITDTQKNFTPGQLVGRTIDASGYGGTVAANSATTITLSANWTVPQGYPTTPQAGTFYAITTASNSRTIVSNTVTTITIAATWNKDKAPANGTSFTINVPAGSLTGGAGVTYTRQDGGGTGSTYGSTSLTDSSKLWSSNEFAGAVVQAGGNSATVSGNSTTSLALSSAWSPATPAADTPYSILASVNDTSKTLTADQLAGQSIVAIAPAVSGSGGTVTYDSYTGSGANVSYGVSTLTDTGAAFPTASGGLAGRTVVVNNVSAVVLSNSATVITLTAPWSTQPIDGAAYVIASMTDTSKTFAVNSLAGRTVISGSNVAVVRSNDAHRLTLQAAWAPATPAAGAAYTITPEGTSGVIASNTATRMSLSSGWLPFAPTAGTPYYVQISSYTATISSNTTQTLNVNTAWSPVQPTNGSTYSVINSQPISACGVGSYQTTITFDPTMLQYVSASNGQFLASTGRTMLQNPCTPTTTTNTVTFSCSTTGGTPLGSSGNGSFLTIKFKPLGALNTTSVVTQTTSVADIQGDTVTHTDQNLTVQFSRCGDVNSSGAVTLSDVALTLTHVGQQSATDPNWGVDQRYDINQSGAVTLSDVSYILDEVGQFCTYT